MKNMNSARVFSYLALALFVSLMPLASATGTAIIKTVPQSTTWIPGNTYRVDIYADNTGLNGWATAAMNWKLRAPSQLSPFMTITQAEWPSSNDFFGGQSIFEQVLGANWNMHKKVVNGNGVANNIGLVATYYISLNSSAPRGTYSFDLNSASTRFYDASAISQPYVVQNIPFTVPLSTSVGGVTKLGSAGGHSSSGSQCLQPDAC